MNSIPLLARALAAVLATTLSLQSIAATALPELGNAAAGSLSPALEKQIGQEALAAFRFQDPAYIDDPEVESYLASIGARLAASGKTGDRNFTFFALKDPGINAFAMPGGVIGVHSGLINTSQSESELAAVIAHEMAHVTQHHIGRSINQQSGSTAVLIASLLIAVLAARNSPTAAEAAIAGGQAAMLQNQLNYSRDFEREADRVGLQILETGGFDPQAMPMFFERMRQAYHGEGDAPAYLRTHPLTNERISDVQGRVRTLPYRQVPDSIEYALIKAKLAVLHETTRETIARLRDKQGGRLLDKAARHYALTLAYIADRNETEARRSYAALSALKLKTPMVATLGGQLELARGHGNDAAKLCSEARISYPGWRALDACVAEGLLAAGDGNGALASINERLATQTGDYRLYKLQAKIYTALDKPALAHRALSHVFQQHGMLRPAIEQMQLAQRSKGASAHEESAIDARLRELRAKMCDELGGKLSSESHPEGGRAGKRRDPDRCDKLAP
ncbi:MAG: M48 family metallopeptidase [Uliginosibacterium sp.]|nr:M48 family metallopeptidase [Uliginosibacterium sp.]